MYPTIPNMPTNAIFPRLRLRKLPMPDPPLTGGVGATVDKRRLVKGTVLLMNGASTFLLERLREKAAAEMEAHRGQHCISYTSTHQKEKEVTTYRENCRSRAIGVTCFHHIITIANVNHRSSSSSPSSNSSTIIIDLSLSFISGPPHLVVMYSGH